MSSPFGELVGMRLTSTMTVIRLARTLVVADLVHNVGRPEGVWTGIYSRAMGFRDRVAMSRMIRWTAFSDRAAARRSVERVLEMEFDKVVVGHGMLVEHGGKEAVRAAFRWLEVSK